MFNILNTSGFKWSSLVRPVDYPLNIPYKTITMAFDDINAAKLWMIKNQRGRRNLTDGWKFELAQVEKAILAEIGAAKKINDGKAARDKQLGVLSIVDKTPSQQTPQASAKEPHNTRSSIADSLGWSTGKTAMADKVWKDATPEIKAQVLSGEVSINEAYKAVKNGDTHVSKNSGENEWYTPVQFIDAARLVMGSIDLDPASSERANETVQATTFYTKEDDGLSKTWCGL